MFILYVEIKIYIHKYIHYNFRRIGVDEVVSRKRSPMVVSWKRSLKVGEGGLTQTDAETLEGWWHEQ